MKITCILMLFSRSPASYSTDSSFPQQQGDIKVKRNLLEYMWLSRMSLFSKVLWIYTNILWHAFISLETSKPHTYRSALYTNLDICSHLLHLSKNSSNFTFHPHFSTHLLEKQPKQLHWPQMLLPFATPCRRHLLPQWKKWRWNQGVESVTHLFRVRSLGGWHLAKQTRQP